MPNLLARFETITRASSQFSASVQILEQDEISKLHPFEIKNIHPAISRVAKNLFDDGYCSQATFEAFKLVDKVVQKLSSKPQTGLKLMMATFDENTPLIKLTPCSNPSEIDEQKGFKFLFSGAVLAIRNPRGHETEMRDDPDTSLDHLSIASTLLRRIEKAGFEIPAKKAD